MDQYCTHRVVFGWYLTRKMRQGWRQRGKATRDYVGEDTPVWISNLSVVKGDVCRRATYLMDRRTDSIKKEKKMTGRECAREWEKTAGGRLGCSWTREKDNM